MKTIRKIFLVLCTLVGSALSHHEGIVPLALVGDRPLSIANSISDIPLLMVPKNELELFTRVHISAVSNTQPLVTCQLNRYSLDAVPAVRVVLREPVVVESPESYLPFPSEINVIHEGLKMSVPVGALIVPIPTTGFQGPTSVRVMYAVPGAPLQIQYPIYSNSPIPYPLRPEFQQTSTETIAKPSLPQTLHPTTSLPQRPNFPDFTSFDLYGSKKPEPPVVTVLNFPSAIASPDSLFYQPPIDESGELGNRNPPEAVIPAGIVQSAQPRPTLQVFLNSKEHPLLQSLRDQAQENKDKVTPNSISGAVEAL